MGLFKNWDDWGALRTLATGSEWGILSKIGMIGGPLERSLPVVNWDFDGFFQKYWDDWGSLERSLPVVNGEFCQELGWCGSN